MDLRYFVEAAEEFGQIVWPLKKEIRFLDLMLYGSVARGKVNPNDLDMLIIHKNPKLDEFQQSIKRKAFSSASEAFIELQKILGKDLFSLIRGTKVQELIRKDSFNTSYFHYRGLRDGEYSREWNLMNEDPAFIKNIIQEGRLWNAATGRYDISAPDRYRISDKRMIAEAAEDAAVEDDILDLENLSLSNGD